MTPRALRRPTPPPKIQKRENKKAHGFSASAKSLCLPFKSPLQDKSFKSFLAFYYLTLLLLSIFTALMLEESGDFHLELIFKIGGILIFFMTVIAIPVLLPNLTTEQERAYLANNAPPLSMRESLDYRLKTAAYLAVSCAAPLLLYLPINMIFSRETLNFYNLLPFFQAVVTSLWVTLLMEISQPVDFHTDQTGNRTAVIAGFIVIHIMLVGLISNIAPSVISGFKFLKLVIAVNPFSQLYILFEGARVADSLTKVSSLQRHFEYHLYLLLVTSLVFLLFLLISRSFLAKRPLRN